MKPGITGWCDVGSIKRSALSTSDLVSRYVAGESAGMLALRAKIPLYRVQEILTAAGIRLRGPSEALRLALDQSAKLRLVRGAKRRAA